MTNFNDTIQVLKSFHQNQFPLNAIELFQQSNFSSYKNKNIILAKIKVIMQILMDINLNKITMK